jgi:predicted ATPase
MAAKKKKTAKKKVARKKSPKKASHPAPIISREEALKLGVEAIIAHEEQTQKLREELHVIFGGTSDTCEFEGISHVTLGNFKGISEPIDVPIRPITLLFGANSAGKSTVIQALHYVRELVENNNADPHITHIDNSEMDLGGFRNLVHKHDLDKEIRIRLRMEVPADGIGDYLGKFDHLANECDWLHEDGEQGVLNHYLDEFSNYCMANIGFEFVSKWDRESNTAFFAEYSLLANDIYLMSISRQSPTLRPMLSQVNYMHPGFLGLGTDTMSSNDLKIEDLASRINKIKKVPGKTEYTLTDEEGFIFFDQPNIEFKTWSSPCPKSFYGEDTVDPSGDTATSPNINNTDNLPFTGLLQGILWGATDYLRKIISNQRYLGPIRSHPPRTISREDLSSKKSWANGLEAWRRLAESCRDDETSELLEALNSWIGASDEEERLAMGYELRITANKLIEKNSDLMRNLNHLKRGFEREPDKFAERLELQLSELQDQTTIRLYDTHTGVEVNVQDVGAGVAQVIPVIVAALDKSGALMMAEQPELHVHPDAQSRLADLFVAQSKKSRMFLLETHSEHMLLRFRRRIREGKLKPDELCVLFVERAKGEEKAASIKRLRVDEDGELIDPWPPGFFESGYMDMDM